MVLNNKFKLVVIVLIIFLTVPWRRFHFHFHSPLKMLKLKFTSRYAEKVVIGLMTCAGGYESTGRGRNETKAMEVASEEPLTLIKSVLISAKIYQATQLEFHIYTDSWLLEETMKKQVLHQKSQCLKFWSRLKKRFPILFFYRLINSVE